MTRVGRQAPRLVLWISGMTFAVLAGVLALVFVALSWQTESRLAESAAADLERGQQGFADAETRRARERRLQAIVLAENPTLKAAVDTYVTETASGTTPDALLPTITQEVGKLAVLLGVPALIVVTTEGDVLSAAGPQAGDWAVGSAVPELGHDGVPDAPAARRPSGGSSPDARGRVAGQRAHRTTAAST